MIKAIRIILLASLCISIFASALPAEDIAEVDSAFENSQTSEMVESPVATDSIQPDSSAAMKKELSLEESYPPPSGNFQMAMLKAIGGLGIVLCLMAGLYYAGRKYFPKYFNKAEAGKSLKLIETLSMGDRRSISIIQVENKRFLIGNTSNQINLLSSMDGETSIALEKESSPTAPVPAEDKRETGTPFRNLFEIEKKRPLQKSGSPLPEDVRMKMRMLREALER